MRARDLLEYAIVLALVRVGCSMPLKASLDFGARLGDFAFSFLRLRRKIALSNLKLAFGAEKTPEEIELIARRTYRHFGRMLMEFARFPKLKPEDLAKLATFSNFGLFEDVLGRGRGGILLSGHFGNWEMMGAAIAMRMGMPLNVLVARQRNRLVDDLINSFRLSFNINPVPVGISAKSILRILKGGGVIGILADQDSRGRGVFVDFMGRPASTPKGPATIALRMKVPVITAFAVRVDAGYRIYFEEIEIPHDLKDDEEGIRFLTQTYTGVLERYVRMYPDQWFWMHRRWKTRPPERSEVQGPKSKVEDRT